MLIQSSNDAAFALTGRVGERAFVDLMNIYAGQMGLRHTGFINPTGLEPDNSSLPMNTSTAEELAVLAEYILEKEPEIFEITANKSYEVLRPDGSLHDFIPQNTNILLGEMPGIIGGKTGWSPAAGGCLLLIFEKPEGNGYYITVVLGADDRFEERLNEHITGRGATIIRRAYEAGHIVRPLILLPGGRREERQLKDLHNTPRIVEKLLSDEYCI